MKTLMTALITIGLILSSTASFAKSLGVFQGKKGPFGVCSAPKKISGCTYSTYFKKKIYRYEEVRGRTIMSDRKGGFDLASIIDGCFGPSTVKKLRFSDPQEAKTGDDILVCAASAECLENPGYYGVVVCKAIGGACPSSPSDCAADDSIEAYVEK